MYAEMDKNMTWPGLISFIFLEVVLKMSLYHNLTIPKVIWVIVV